jgi:hypothetical protein
MMAYEKSSVLRAWTFGLVLAALSLMSSRVHAMPSDYEEDDTNKAAHSCLKTYGGNFDGVGVPKTKVEPDRYVLLLVFRNQRDGDRAAHDLFRMPRRNERGESEVVGCVADAAYQAPMKSKDASEAEENWAVAVQGGCPSDCTGGRETLAEGSTPPVPDPLKSLKLQWGIFFASSDKTDSNSKVRVWQIRVKNAVQAYNILGQLYRSGLRRKCGYKGYLLIGYVPQYTCQKGDKCE